MEWPTEYMFVMHAVPGHTQASGAVKRGAFKGGWTAAGLQSWCSKRAAEAVRLRRLCCAVRQFLAILPLFRRELMGCELRADMCCEWIPSSCMWCSPVVLGYAEALAFVRLCAAILPTGNGDIPTPPCMITVVL